MSSTKREKVLRAGLILSAICLVGSVILLTQHKSGSTGRIAMIMTGITALLTGLTFFLQIRRNRL
jgi:uncharacterized membrane protein